jgi:hypothetical protein
MSGGMVVYEPVPAQQGAARHLRKTLDGLAGKVVGFIDNAKPNFNHMVDDLGELLVAKHGVAAVFKHRKPGQVPVPESVLKEFAEKCDAVITGSGD